VASSPRALARLLPLSSHRSAQRGFPGPHEHTRRPSIDSRPAEAPHRGCILTSSSVEIIIVNWNSRQHTLDCVAAVDAQLAETANASITVVDNGSTDGSATAIAARFPRVKLFALPTNRGFTGGISTALAGSDARYVVFLNNDAVPEKGWLRALTGAMDATDEDVVSIAGKIVDLGGKLIDFIGGVMTFDGHAFQTGFRYPLGSREEPPAGTEIFFPCGGNMISRRAALFELGAFDDDYFAYLEDVDFGWRAWLAGYRVLYEPAALVRHASSATSDRLGNFERGVLFERNALQTVIKNYDDEMLREVAGPIFLTYLHRLHHYATTRNNGAGELTRSPFEGTPTSQSPGLLSRLWHRMVPRSIATIEDPLTAMQFRAFEWVIRNERRVLAKRERVQAMRKRPDEEIFTRFPLHFVPTYPGDEALMTTALFRLLRPRAPSVDGKLSDIIAT
jgi:GT2 family glycosyltransferase